MRGEFEVREWGAFIALLATGALLLAVPAATSAAEPQPAVHVSGVLLDATGVPVPEARFGLLAPDGSSGTWIDTDATGSFEADVNAGDYLVRVWAPARTFLDQVSITPQTSELELRLPELATIRGQMLDQRGQPMPGFYVRVWSDDAAPEDEYVLSDATDSEGNYTFTVVAGPATVEVWHPFRNPLPEPRALDLRPGDTPLDWTVLSSGITGTVRDDNGDPVAGVLVHTEPDWVDSPDYVESDVTDAYGQFEIELLDGPGTYVIWTDASTHPGFVRYFATTATPIEGGEWRPTDLVLVPDGTEPELAAPAQPRVAVNPLAARRIRVAALLSRASEPATTYEARCFHDGVRAGTATGTTPRLVVRQLDPRTTYRCSVRAGNDGGWSPFSDRSRLVRTPARR